MKKIEKLWVLLSSRLFVILSVLSFLLFVLIGIYYVYINLASPQKFNVEPSSQFSEYQREKLEEHERQYQTEIKNPERTSKNNQNQIFEKKADYILKNLSSYAKVMGEEPINREKFFLYLDRQLTAVIGVRVSKQSEWLKILSELEKQTKIMLEEAPKLKVLPLRDKRRIFSRDYLKWFFLDLRRAYQEADRKNAVAEQLDRISKEGVNNPIMLSVWLGLFGGFVIFLIILVILRVDRGIRKISSKIDNIQREYKSGPTSA